MRINIFIKIKEKNDKHLCVGIIEAIKNGVVLKKDIIKNVVVDINDFLLDIKNRFTKGITPSMNLFIYSNVVLEEEFVSNIFFTKQNLLDDNIDFSEHFVELEKENICPSFIYEIKETNLENEVHLYLISSFFQDNIHLIFEFPLYLHMKNNGLIDENYEVEDLVEDKYIELLKFNN